MKSKRKLLVTVIVGCALVLAFTASAGCFGSDPIVGTYLKSYSDGDVVYDFHSGEYFYVYYILDDGTVEKDGPFSWKKTGDNRYESGKVIYSLSSDGYTLYVKPDGETSKSYTKYSNYQIPTVSPTAKATVNPTTKSTVSPTVKPTVTATSTPTSSASLGEQNAVQKAKSYISWGGFSRTGLIEQLEYEGFTHSEAVYGADNCGANWNEMAAKKAKSYMSWGSFSRTGLKEQLEYEGFTSSQISYALSAVGY